MILELIPKFFGIGSITKLGKDSIMYRVTSLEDLMSVIIPHFNKYPLLTQKHADFLLFKEIVDLMSNKVHLTIEGLNKIIAIRASMNLGLPEELKVAFSNV